MIKPDPLDRWNGKWKPPKIKHGKLTKYNWLVLYPDNLHLGYGVDIGAFTFIMAKYGVYIDDYVQIGSGCKIYSENTIDGTKGYVTLRKNCKIGANSVILPGIIIGENSIVGALTLVKHDVPENTKYYADTGFITQHGSDEPKRPLL